MFHFHCSIVVYCMITCAQLRLTICDPMDCSPPGSPVLEIFLAISLPFPTPGDRPDSGFKPVSLAPPALVGVHAKSLQSCPVFCDRMDCSPPGCSVHEDSPGKDTGVGCHTLLQEIFPT